MVLKEKSILVAVISSAVIFSVLILTIAAFSIYTELKGEEFKRTYQHLLRKTLAGVYAKHIIIPKLNVMIEIDGPLKGKPVVEGVVRNEGARRVTDLVLRVRLKDQDQAMLYEVVFRPHEPSLGTATMTQIAIPYITGVSKMSLESGAELPFKRVLVDCPPEIVLDLQKGRGFSKNSGRWSGTSDVEVVSVSF